jgi:glutamate N-acetyltransferase/amino-acid N-acetyltransferase
MLYPCKLLPVILPVDAMNKISPLAPKSFPEMPALPGLRLATAACGVRYHGRQDLLLVELAHGTAVAGLFTHSQMPSAPVDWCKKALLGGAAASALIVNSGNANAFVGKAGIDAVERIVETAADLFPCRPSTVFVASTGVIGEPLEDAKITAALPALKKALRDDIWKDAAQAITTTDTFPKGASRAAVIGDTQVVINGIAKGSGMIAPDMATMLAFVFTDASIPAWVLQDLLTAATAKSFNCITVDSDTSTSDTVLLFATGRGARHEAVNSADDRLLDDFRDKLDHVMLDLAHQVVRDGEGASKFVTIRVEGAADDGAARRIGLAIANSPLVKTAIAGEDANWGRIVMAVGKSGEKADRDRLTITIGGVPVAAGGAAVAGYDEAPVARHMQGAEVCIAVGVGVGEGCASVWTCDLSHGYIDINADYRT